MAQLINKIKFYRQRAGISKKDLAEKLNMSVSTITAYENGQIKPSYDALLALSDSLAVSVDELMGKPNPFDAIDDVTFNVLKALARNEDMRNIISDLPDDKKCRECPTVQLLCGIIAKLKK